MILPLFMKLQLPRRLIWILLSDGKLRSDFLFFQRWNTGTLCIKDQSLQEVKGLGQSSWTLNPKHTKSGHQSSQGCDTVVHLGKLLFVQIQRELTAIDVERVFNLQHRGWCMHLRKRNGVTTHWYINIDDKSCLKFKQYYCKWASYYIA